MKKLLFLIPVLAFARPTPEIVKADDLNHTLRTWRKSETLNWRYLNEPELAGMYEPNDVAMWEAYKGQPIAVGDLILYVSSTTKKPIVREIASVDPLKTTRHFIVPPDKVLGIVRRVVRVVPN